MGLHAGERGNLICLCSHSHRTGIPPNQWNGNAPASNYVGFRDASVTAALLILSPRPWHNTQPQIKFAEHQDDLLTIEGTQSALRVHQLLDSRAQYEREPWPDNKGTYQNRSGLK